MCGPGTDLYVVLVQTCVLSWYNKISKEQINSRYTHIYLEHSLKRTFRKNVISLSGLLVVGKWGETVRIHEEKNKQGYSKKKSWDIVLKECIFSGFGLGLNLIT